MFIALLLGAASTMVTRPYETSRRMSNSPHGNMSCMVSLPSFTEDGRAVTSRSTAMIKHKVWLAPHLPLPCRRILDGSCDTVS
jgi:hypothetical protein